MPTTADASVSVPVFQPDEVRHRRKIADWTLQANQGHIQNVGNVTLAASTISTDVVDSRVGMNSFIGLMPMSANGLSAGPTVWVSTIGSGTFSITHGNSASVDKTFRYCLLG